MPGLVLPVEDMVVVVLNELGFECRFELRRDEEFRWLEDKNRVVID